MELRQLRYFVKVCELRSMGRAALELDIVTSALSQQISRLESELATRLLQDGAPKVDVLVTAGAEIRDALHDLIVVDNSDSPGSASALKAAAESSGFTYLPMNGNRGIADAQNRAVELVLSRGAEVEPLIHGGGQQRQVRSGTQEAPAAISFGVAASAVHPSLLALRDRVIDGVRAAVPSAVLRGDPTDRLPNNAHFTFPGCEGDSLLFLLDVAGVSVSTGSACQAGIPEASHVLLARGLSASEARGALRITVGPTTPEADVDALLAALPGAVEKAQRAGFADRDVTGVDRERRDHAGRAGDARD